MLPLSLLIDLYLPKSRILSIEVKQLLMLALLDNSAIAKHNNLIGIDNGGKAMSNHQRCVLMRQTR